MMTNSSSNDKETKALKTSISKLRDQGVTIQNINEGDSSKHFSYSDSGDIERFYDAMKPKSARVTNNRIKPEAEYWTPGSNSQNSESIDSK